MKKLMQVDLKLYHFEIKEKNTYIFYQFKYLPGKRFHVKIYI